MVKRRKEKKGSEVRAASLEKAYRLGFEYEKKYRGCSQCALAAIYDTLNIQDEKVFKAATGFAGGGGLTGISMCGGYAAGVMAISQLCGRDLSNFADPDEFAKFEAAGGHEDKCTDVVGKATRVAVKFILDHELLSKSKKWMSEGSK